MKTKIVAILLLSNILMLISTLDSLSQTASHQLLIKTSMGDMKCILYEQTPMHADNFIDLVKKGIYNGVLFHRVIKDFMIQSGDPESKNEPKGALLWILGTDNTVHAEFNP